MSYGGGSLSNGSNGAGPEGSGWLGRKGNEWLFVNPYLVVGVVGASFCFAWMFSILLRPGYPGIEAFGPHSSQLFRVVFSGALAVTDLIIALLSNVLQRHRRPLLAVGATGALASELLPLLPAASESSVAFFAAAIAAAVGLGLLGALWMEFLCAHLKQAARKAASTLFLLALVWYLGLLLVDSAFVTGISMLFVLLSTATYAVLSALYAPMDTMPEVDARDSDSRYAITWRPSLLTVMGSLAEGFALYWLLDPSGNEEVNAYLICLLSLVVCAAVLVDSVKRFVLRERVIRRLFLPVLAACFLTVLFLPRQWIFVPCLLAYGFSMLPYLSAIFATCEHIVRCRLSPIRAFARARVPAAAGLTLGLAIGWLAFESDLFGEVNLQAWAFVVVMFFILVFAILLPSQSFYPGDEMTPLGPVRIGPNGEIETDGDLSSLVDGSRYFQEKCDAVSALYGLTSRQTEVLYLLAKGRNASYIQEKLVISPHTVKAHIYTIYKKTDQHSQQDLMDLVEGFDLDQLKGGRR